MRTKRILAGALSLVLCVSVLFAVPAIASVFTFETQYDYGSADKAWLTDLVIKEDMNDLTAVGGRCTLVPAPDYPYTETAASFKEEVDQFCRLYSLNENTLKASYLYLFELLGSNSSVFAAQASDAQVKSYLQSQGVIYPASGSADMDVLAKALYTAMLTGAFQNLTGIDSGAGIGLEKALTQFVLELSGFSEAELSRWMPSGKLDSLDDYILAVSRMTLWSNGYEADVNTPEDEVYKLMAVMTIRNLGVSVDSDVSFSELQSKYTAALMGKRYGVSVSPARLSTAINNGSAAYYILQLIGQQQGLTVREENQPYEDAFLFVASHSDLFDVEEDEFYADIYAYDIYLSAPRSSLWIYPTSYYGSIDSSAVTVSCNGSPIKDNYYTQVPVSPTADVQKLTITVDCTAGSGSVKEYVITVHSEDAIRQSENKPGNEDAKTDTSKTVLSSNAIVSRILNAAGVDPDVAEAAGNLIYVLPENVQNAISFISPTFNDPSAAASDTPAAAPVAATEPASSADAAPFISRLDTVGTYVNSMIGGIDGIGLGQKFKATGFDYNFVTIGQ